jgi:hypothetical protein
MHLHRLKTLGCAVALSALWATTALGSDTPAQANDVARQADKHFLLGKEQLKAGNVREAYTEYKAAWDLKRSYDIAANLGNVEFELGMPRDAAEHLSFALKNAAVSVPQDKIEKIKARLAEAKNLVGATVVQVNIDGAEVFIDGRSVGRSPLTEELYVDPGPCTVEAKLAGHDNARETVDFRRATTRTVMLTLKLTGSVGPAASASASGQTPPPPPPGKSLVPVSIGIGLGAVGLGLGIAGFALSGAKGGEIDTLKSSLDALDTHKTHSVCQRSSAPSECGALDDAYRAQGSLRNLGIAGLAVTGVAALGTAVYLLYPSARPEAAPKVRASFGIAPGAAGVRLDGRF